MKLFVYGTLLRGKPNHARLAGCTFIKSAHTDHKYEMVENGRFPALKRGVQSIFGEIYEVPDEMWPMLDRFEGATGTLDTSFYLKEIDIVDGNEVFFYLGNNCLKHGAWELVPSGDYRDIN